MLIATCRTIAPMTLWYKWCTDHCSDLEYLIARNSLNRSIRRQLHSGDRRLHFAGRAISCRDIRAIICRRYRSRSGGNDPTPRNKTTVMIQWRSVGAPRNRIDIYLGKKVRMNGVAWNPAYLRRLSTRKHAAVLTTINCGSRTFATLHPLMSRKSGR